MHFLFMKVFLKKYNYIKILLVKLKKSQKLKENAFYLIPKTQPHYFLKYQIQNHPATDAYMHLMMWIIVSFIRHPFYLVPFSLLKYVILLLVYFVSFIRHPFDLVPFSLQSFIRHPFDLVPFSLQSFYWGQWQNMWVSIDLVPFSLQWQNMWVSIDLVPFSLMWVSILGSLFFWLSFLLEWQWQNMWVSIDTVTFRISVNSVVSFIRNPHR